MKKEFDVVKKEPAAGVKKGFVREIKWCNMRCENLYKVQERASYCMGERHSGRGPVGSYLQISKKAS